MKKLFVLMIVVMLMGCASFGLISKTSGGYAYVSSINPDDIEGRKYQVVKAEMVDPFTVVVFYFQPEKDRIVGAIYTSTDGSPMSLYRFWYVEKDDLVIISRNEANLTWERNTLEELEIPSEYRVTIMEHLDVLLRALKQEQKL